MAPTTAFEKGAEETVGDMLSVRRSVVENMQKMELGKMQKQKERPD
jgi:hypothetical protein